MPVIYVNKSGGLIKNGQPVAYLGTQGNRISVTLAQGNSDATGKVLGVATSDIEKNQEGKVTVFGKVRKIPDVTLFGTGLTTGKIWLATAPAGNYTSTEPSAPNHCDMVGYLVNTGNNQGEIDVNVIPHKTLQELSDVNGTPLTTSGQFPVWDNTRGVFDFTSNVVDIGVSTGMIVHKLLASTNTWTAQQIMTATSISTLVAGTATVTGIMRVGDMWHVVGGTINANTTITIGSANTWYRITNATQNLLSNTHELNGFTITNDSITILNKGHYNGTISISFTGTNTQEYAFRMLNVTQGTSTNYPLSCAGSGSNNNVLYSRGLYIKANANDVIIFQVLNESGTGNITIHDARYEIYYLHD
jgi:hypothetical protein